MAARGRSRSTAFALLAVLAAGFGLGVLWSRTGTAPSPERVPYEAAAEGAPASIEGPSGALSALPAGPGRPARSDGPHAAAAQPSPVDASAAATIPEPTPEFPGLDVWVTSADGAPMSNVTVYARLAGAPPLPDMAVPQVATDGEGHGRLLLPGPGRFDVGAVLPLANQAMETDVDVPTRKEVRLRFPAWDRVRVVLDEAIPTLAGESRSVSLQVGSRNPRTGYLPARGEAYGPANNLSFPVSARETSLSLPVGRDFVVNCQLANVFLVPVPVSTQAPGTVRLEVRDPTRVRVHLVREERTFSTNVEVHIDFHLEERDEPLRLWRLLPAGTQLSRLDGIWATVGLTSRNATLRWAGLGTTPGSATRPVEKDAAGKSEVTLTIEVRDPPPAPVEPEDVPLPDVRVDLDLRALPKHGEGSVYTGEGPGPGTTSHSISTEGDSARVEVPSDSTWLLAMVSPDGVAGPLRRVGAEEPTLKVVRGGFLVAVPEAMPPDSLGAPLISRADGLPMPYSGDGPHADPVLLQVGMLLGPFEPGEVAFTLTLGGLPAGEVRAVVRPGVTLPLRIPAFRPAGAR